MHQCPKCSSQDIHRSHAKSRWESWRKELTGKRPYRCRACGWRGWGVDLDEKFGDAKLEVASGALAPDPPSLKGTALAHDEHRPPDIDLYALDAPEPIAERPK